jgi:hypothetical protein
MAYVKNPESGVVQSPFGRELGWVDQVSRDLFDAKLTKVGSTSRRKAAELFIRAALKSCGTVIPAAGASDGLAAIGVNSWIIPYLENAVVLLSGEGELDW